MSIDDLMKMFDPNENEGMQKRSLVTDDIQRVVKIMQFLDTDKIIVEIDDKLYKLSLSELDL